MHILIFINFIQLRFGLTDHGMPPHRQALTLYVTHSRKSYGLTSNGFEPDFIISAKFDIFISRRHQSLQLLTCEATLADRAGKIYKSKKYTERAYDNQMKVFKPTMIQTLRKWFASSKV